MNDGKWTDEEMAMMKDMETEDSSHAMMKTDMEMEDSAMIADSGAYTNFSEKEWQNVYGKKPFVLFFHASWCPTCKRTDGEISANLSKIPAGTKILKIDYDTAIDFKKKYGITTQDSFVYFDANGNEQGKSVGDTIDDIASTLSSLKK